MTENKSPTYLGSKPAGNEERPMPGVLVAHTPQGGTPKHYLEIDGTVVIGRAESALPLPDTGISRRHIRITRQPTVCTIEDLGSRNGTLMDSSQGSCLRW